METLASRIEREGGLPEIDAVGWVIRLAFSVEQIHALGSVHGRLSADGILITEDRCTSEGRLIPFAELPENVAYHSPERERGEGGSHADDTWAVAVILYLALSGNLPFSGTTDDEVRRKIRSVPAPPLAVFDVGDDALQAIVDRALARNRESRTATVGDLRRELEAWRPDARLDALPPLLTDEEPDEEVTMIQIGLSSAVRQAIDAATAPPKRTAPPPRPRSVAPPPVIESEPAGLGGGHPHTPGPSDDEKTIALKPSSLSAASLAAMLEVPKPAETTEAFPAPAKPAGAPLSDLADEDSSPDDPDDPFAVRRSRAEVRVSTLPPAPHDAPAPASASAAPPRSSAAKPAAPAPSSGKPSMGIVAGVAAAIVAAIVVVVVFGRGGSETEAPKPLASSTPVTTVEAPKPPATHEETPPPPASATAPAATSASAVTPAVSSSPASIPAPAGVSACVVPLFPPESFSSSADFSFLCSETDPLKSGGLVRTQLVQNHHNISDGMREWALLGWYEMAAVAVIRERCCPSAPPLQLPEVHGCAPVPEVLAGIAAATAAATDPSDKAIKKAVDAYTDDIHCIVRAGMPTRFGRVGNPQGGEDTTLMRFLARAVTAKR